MRYIIEFIIFGLIFYALYLYTPDFFGADIAPEFSSLLGCRPAQHRLRRPEVYRRLVEPLPTDFDYWYFLKEREKAK